MRLIALSDGASGEFSATFWTLPTSSNCGTAMLVMAASATHNSRIGQKPVKLRRELPGWTNVNGGACLAQHEHGF